MKIVYITALLVAVAASELKAGENGKHLFILSGQSNMANLNPAESFIPTVESAFGKSNVIVVKDAYGGRAIKGWYNHEARQKDAGAETRGRLYLSLINKVKDGIKDVKLRTVTFVWMQGESDVRETADIYADCLDGLIGQLKEDLAFKDINFVIGRISDYGIKDPSSWERWKFTKEGWEKIRSIQVEYAESYPRGAWVDTDDCNDGEDGKGRMVENDLHYSVEGYRKLGKRFADAAIKLIRSQKE